MGTDEELLEFPCNFPIKIMGRSDSEFREAAHKIVQQHFDIKPSDVAEQPSRNGRFVSLTFTVKAMDRPGLDALYRDLSSDKRFLMVL